MKDEIIKLAKSIGIDIIGFTKVENYLELKKIYQRQSSSMKTPFQIGEIESKTMLKEMYPNYESFIVIGMGYNSSKNIKLNEGEVYLSSSSWGEDYHIVLKNKLNIISEYLNQKGYNQHIFVDNNLLDERYIAYKAGLGFYGKNHLLINDKLGTNFFIGIIMTNAVFEYDKAMNKTCFKCNKCVESCPTKALGKSFLEGKKCLSYLTQKKNLTDEEKEYFNNCIYGCDICMNVCPHNNKLKENYNFRKTGIELISLKGYEHLSNSEWNKKYGKLSCSWRGRNIFERNLNIYKEKLEKK